MIHRYWLCQEFTTKLISCEVVTAETEQKKDGRERGIEGGRKEERSKDKGREGGGRGGAEGTE